MLINFFKRNKKSDVKTSQEEVEAKLASFYGIDELGNPLPELRIQHNLSEIECCKKTENSCKYILSQINSLKQTTIFSIMEKLSWLDNKNLEYLIALRLMQALSEGWKDGKEEIDITPICNKKYQFYQNHVPLTVEFENLQCLFETISISNNTRILKLK